MDIVTLTAQTNQHFVLNYNSTLITALTNDYPNANWRMQARTEAGDVNVAYQWASSGISNPIFDGSISASTLTGLTILAPQSDMASLAGAYVFDIRLEDTASNAVLVAVSGQLIINQGVSLAYPNTQPPEPDLVQTVVVESGSTTSEIPPIVSAAGVLVVFAGQWNASLNVTAPIGGTGAAGALTSGVGAQGEMWEVTEAGTTMLDGFSSWAVGDFAFFDGTAWQKISSGTVMLSFSSITGVVDSTQLPTPTTTTLGAVLSSTAPANKFMTGIDGGGNPTYAQPAANQIANLAPSGTTDTTNATNITSGTLSNARLPSSNSTRVLLNTLSASSSSALSDTTSLTAAYLIYDIEFDQVLPGTSAATFMMQIQSGGTFPATSYSASIFNNDGSGSATVQFTTGIGLSSVSGTGRSPATSGCGINGRITIMNPAGGGYKGIVGNVMHSNTGSAGPTFVSIAGVWTGGTGAITGAQFYFSSGNIASGSINIYGRTS